MHLRLAREEDAAGIQAIYAPEVIETAITFEIEPPTTDDFRGRIRETTAMHPWLVCEDGSEILGYAYASSHRPRAAYRWSVDVAVYIHRQQRGRRIGKALYTALLGILPRQGFHRAYGGITLPNAGSVALHESVGFRPVGVYEKVGYKLGAWRDVGWWALEIQPPAASPTEPRPLPQILAGGGVDAELSRGASLLRRGRG